MSRQTHNEKEKYVSIWKDSLCVHFILTLSWMEVAYYYVTVSFALCISVIGSVKIY